VQIHFASKSSVLLYWQRYCTAFEQWASAKLCGVVSSRDGCDVRLVSPLSTIVANSGQSSDVAAGHSADLLEATATTV